MIDVMRPALPVLHNMSETALSAACPFPGNVHPGLSAEDMIDFYKVMPCPRACNHDWATCLYAHPNEKARRRSLAEHWHSAIFCVDMLHKSECKHGDECNLAHSVFEYWMHPDKFRTKYCKDGADCKRTVCFFAHSPQELRHPGQYTPRAASSSSCSSSPSAFGLPYQSGGSCGSLGSGNSGLASLTPSSMLSPAAYGAAGGIGAACFSPLQSPVNYRNGLDGGSDISGSASAALNLQQQIALLLQQQQHRVPDTASLADSTTAQLQQLQDAATNQAAVELARLKVEYDHHVREAELAAVKAAEASSHLQQLAAALNAPSSQAAGAYSPYQAANRIGMASPIEAGANHILMLQQRAASMPTDNLPVGEAAAAAAAVRTPSSASRLLQLESAQRLPTNIPGLGYSPSSTAVTAGGIGFTSILGGSLHGFEAGQSSAMSLENQLMSLGLSASSPGSAVPGTSGSPAAVAGLLPASAALTANGGMGQLQACDASGGLTLAGFLAMGGSTAGTSTSGSGGGLLPGDQVLSAAMLLPPAQQQPTITW